MTTITIPFKKGDTFVQSWAYTIDGVPAPLPPVIRSQLRTQDDKLVAELIPTPTDTANGKFTLTCDDSSLFPVDLLNQDIQFTDLSGKVMSTFTFVDQILKDITHD